MVKGSRILVQKREQQRTRLERGLEGRSLKAEQRIMAEIRSLGHWHRNATDFFKMDFLLGPNFSFYSNHSSII